MHFMILKLVLIYFNSILILVKIWYFLLDFLRGFFSTHLAKVMLQVQSKRQVRDQGLGQSTQLQDKPLDSWDDKNAICRAL